jgi:hypothetical protein
MPMPMPVEFEYRRKERANTPRRRIMMTETTHIISIIPLLQIAFE